MTNTKEEMVEAVKKYAKEHYNEDGWDFVIECSDDADIIQDMWNATTNEEAIAKVGEICKLLNGRRKDVEAEIF